MYGLYGLYGQYTSLNLQSRLTRPLISRLIHRRGSALHGEAVAVQPKTAPGSRNSLTLSPVDHGSRNL